MRILIYDNNQNEVESLYQMIKLLPIQTIVDIVTTYEEAIHLYSLYEYNRVFINYIDTKGKDLERYIMDKSPQQNIILLKDTYDCIHLHSCKKCKEFFNKFLVIKPINISQLPKIINDNFECEGYSKTLYQYNLDKIIKRIKHKYPTIIFDKEKNKFKFDDIPNSFIVELFIDLTTQLSQHNIEYRIYENKSIDIISEREE
ncbi:MAG: hypothetical protein ACNI25_09415 [Halarcobacter sp.]